MIKACIYNRRGSLLTRLSVKEQCNAPNTINSRALRTFNSRFGLARIVFISTRICQLLFLNAVLFSITLFLPYPETELRRRFQWSGFVIITSLFLGKSNETGRTNHGFMIRRAFFLDNS